MRKHSRYLLIGLAAISLAACASDEETVEVTKPEMGDTRIDLTSGDLMDERDYRSNSYGTPALSSVSTSGVEIYSLDGPAGRITGAPSSYNSAPSFSRVGNSSVEITGFGQPTMPRQNTGYMTRTSDADYMAKKNTRPQPVAASSGQLMGTVYFDHSSTSLNNADLAVIQEAARNFNASSSGMLSVEGHSSTRAQAENPVSRKGVNLVISADRAAEVAKALINFGVPGDRIKTIAWGEEHPASSSDAMSTESASRRVEIISVSGQ